MFLDTSGLLSFFDRDDAAMTFQPRGSMGEGPLHV
jgi:hypothetical protein